LPSSLRTVLITTICALAAARTPCVHAQATPAISDADLEQARRSQPVITDDDIRRVQQRHPMPGERELAPASVPSAPRVDALPAPASVPPVDLEALAKGYAAEADSTAAAQGKLSGPALLVFVSFSMPHPTLQRLVAQAASARATLVLRGMVNGSLRDTVAHVHALTGEREVAFQIDPQAFARFSVRSTPTFVLMRAGTPALPCGAGPCVSSDVFATVSGDVSLDYALRFIARGAPAFARDVRSYLKRLGG
jgi:conjugal transfer pilus assembly protein TrbC